MDNAINTSSDASCALDLMKFAAPELVAWKDELRAIRRDIHKHPEIGLEVPRTAAVIAENLRKWGVDEVHTGIGGHGVVGVVYGRETSSHMIGIRGDIDALPLVEESKHDHVSIINGRMHGCGHDGHAALVLGAARYLAATRNFAGKAVMIFQPGEEGWAGAKEMVDDGLFERFPVDEVYAAHNWPGIPAGHVGLNSGPMMACADAFEITVNGRGGHGARPHNNIDPVVAAAQIIVALQTIVSRNVPAADVAVVSCCSLRAGDPGAQSVVPSTCQIVGTSRAFRVEVQDIIESRMKEIATGMATAMGCTAQVDYRRIYPATVNSPEQAKALGDVCAEILGEDRVDRDFPRSMGSEDFSFMLLQKPGAYIRLGQGGISLHNNHYDFNDEILPMGSTILSRIVEKRLAVLNAKK